MTSSTKKHRDDGDTLFSFGSFSFSTRDGQLRGTDKDGVLRPKTAALLTHLIRNRERFVSKAELLEVIWFGESVHEQVVFQSVAEIRKALGGSHFIKTIPKNGYRWIHPIQNDLKGEKTTVVKGNKKVQWIRNGKVKWAITLSVCFFLFLPLMNAWEVDNPGSHLPVQPPSNAITASKTAPILAVLPVENQASPQKNWISLGLMDMISQELSRDHQILTIPTEKAMVSYRREGRPAINSETVRFFSKLLHVPHVLGSRATITHDGYSLTYWLSQGVTTHQGTLEGADMSELTAKVVARIRILLLPDQTVVADKTGDPFVDLVYAQGLEHFFDGAYEKAVERFALAHEQMPESVPTLLMLARGFQELGAFTKAREFATRGLRLGSDTSPAWQKMEIHRVIAAAALAQKDPSTALIHAQTVLDLGVRYPCPESKFATWLIKAKALMAQGSFKLADQALGQAERIHAEGLCRTTHAQLLAARGELLEKQGDLDQAWDHYHRALSMANQDRDQEQSQLLSLRLVSFELKRGHLQEARNYLSQLVPMPVPKKRSLALAEHQAKVVDLLAEARLFKDIETFFQKHFDKNNPYHLEIEGRYFWSQGQHHLAEQKLARATVLFEVGQMPERAAAAGLRLGENLLALGRVDKAQIWLNYGQNLVPDVSP